MGAGVAMGDPSALAALALAVAIEFVPGPSGTRVVLDGEDVSEAIRAPEVTAHVHHVAGCAALRRAIVPLQRKFAQSAHLVAEGRDMGTVVFPEAEAKFYLDANPRERARRRVLELRAKRVDASVDEVLARITERDSRDASRDTAPLRVAPDAVVIDTTRLSVDEVVAEIKKRISGLG